MTENGDIFPRDGEDTGDYMMRLRDNLVELAAAEGENIDDYIAPPETRTVEEIDAELDSLGLALSAAIQTGDHTALDEHMNRQSDSDRRREMVGRINRLLQADLDETLDELS